MRDPEPQLQQDTHEDILYQEETREYFEYSNSLPSAEEQFENHDCHASPEDGCDCQKIAPPNA